MFGSRGVLSSTRRGVKTPRCSNRFHRHTPNSIMLVISASYRFDILTSMHEFESVAHAKTRLRYHLIFATKYRRKALLGIEPAVYAAFREAEQQSDFRITTMGIDNGDHVHVVVKFKPALSIEQVVRRMKQLTTQALWNEH
jgi:hypothetical protein